MFGFFQKGRRKETDESVIPFYLRPLYDSLTARQKSEFKRLADTLHFEIHQAATVFDFTYLTQCCLRKRRDGELGIALPNEAAIFMHDPDFARRMLEIYFPVEQFESVKKLRQFVPNQSPPNDVISIVAGEAAIRALRRDFYSNRKSAPVGSPPMVSAADFVSDLPHELQESFLKYCASLVKEFQNIRARLKDPKGNPISPIFIMDACFVAFGEARENPKLLINPNQELAQLRARTGVQPSASVLLRELRAHNTLLANVNDKTAFNALIAEAALKLLSGEQTQSMQKSTTRPMNVGDGSAATDEKPSMHPRREGSRPKEAKRNRPESSSSNAVQSSRSPRIVREIDRRPDRQSYTGIWDRDSRDSSAQSKPSSSRTRSPKPKAHDISHEPSPAQQVVQNPFCAPVIIERPSPAIGEDKLVEDVGLTTSNGDFITILDKFSWLPHARTIRIPLDVPTSEPVTVTFARRRSAFKSDFTTLGTFLLPSFSSRDDASTNTLEIRVSAIDVGLHFEVRDGAGSGLTLKRK